MALFSSAAFSLKHILLFLVTLCVMGNTIFTFSSSSDARRRRTGFRLSARGAFLASAPLSCQDYPPRENRRGYGFKMTGESGGAFGRHYLGGEFSWRYAAH